MLLIDSRTGSKELLPLMNPYSIRCQLCVLDFGDFHFSGNGPRGKVSIGVERKRIDDLIESMQSGRLSGHQLPGLSECYDYCYLVVEGAWRTSPDGQLEVQIYGKWKPIKLHFRALESYLCTLELHAGIIYRKTYDMRETAALVAALYRYWNDKQWADHRSHQMIYTPVHVSHRSMTLYGRKVSVLEKIAAQLPGIDSKAEAVAKHFGTVRRLAEAGPQEWQKIKGVGKIGANRIVEVITKGSQDTA